MLQQKLDNARRMRKRDAGDSSEYDDSGDSDVWSDTGDTSEYDDSGDSDGWSDSDSSDYGEYMREGNRMIDDRYYRRSRREMAKTKKGQIHDDDNFRDYDSPSDSDDSGRRVNQVTKARMHHGST